MSKANTIRKRAQECVKKHNWEGAIKEYTHLSELDQSNPNVYNELGDLFLKVDRKPDAIRSFEKAIDAYNRVGLFNNAVAVCKKLLRFQSGNNEILAKLGKLRKQQGLLKDAVSYYLSYLEKIALDVNLEPKDMANKVISVAEDVPESVDVLEKAAENLIKWKCNEDAARVLTKLRRLCEKKGMEEQAADVCDRIEELGVSTEILQETPQNQGEDTNQTKEELWTVPPSIEGAQIESGRETSPAFNPSPATGREPTQVSTSNDLQDYQSVDFDRTPDMKSPQTVGQATTPSPSTKESPKLAQEEAERETQEVTAEGKQLSEGNVWIPKTELPDPLATGKEDDEGKVVHVSQIIDEFKSEIKESVDEEDYRSHYDLGMAYLEMDFLSEAIREFQFAAKSSAYRLRSLEMIGMCFINQNQPSLAIKQLSKWLELVGSSERETLGLRYNLGLAYEMVGEKDKAKSCFEDVYVIDVTFRDVAEKIRQYSG